MNLLDPSALLDQLPRLLEAQAQGQDPASEATPAGQAQLRTPADALVALSHTILTKLSFRLVSLSDSSSSDTTLTSGNVLPADRWNSSQGTYTLHYTHDQSSLHFLLKALTLGPRIIFHATALESNRTESYEVELDRFTSESFFPWPHGSAAASSSSSVGAGNSAEPLVNGFVSSSRIADFVLGFQAKIIQKLVPGLRKEGYEELPEEEASASSSSARPPPGQQPRQPRFEPPDVDVDGTQGFPQPGRNPLIIGDRDLDPLGGIGGRGPFSPPPLFGGGGGVGGLGGDDGGGMIVGPNHPMFRDRFQNPSQGGLGGGGMVPPGARFDPVGPFGQGPMGPGAFRGGRGGARGGGPGGRGRGTGEPDWDDMPPPGGVSGETSPSFRPPDADPPLFENRVITTTCSCKATVAREMRFMSEK